MTNRTGWTGRCRSGELITPGYFDVQLSVEERAPSRRPAAGRWGAVTLELQDIDYVRYQSSAIVLGLSLTRAPDELEIELIQAWPSLQGTDRPLRIEGRNTLVVEVPSAAAALTCIEWLMSDEGLPAIIARATVVADASDRLYADVQALINRRYDTPATG